ncbi:MAG TPA: terminase [Pseudonocardiaceae bacterium]|nr:terminase [Pseudonocardiaceae bacterium]
MWTRPLRELTEDTSFGYDVIWFAGHVLGVELFPYQEWLLIHLGELLPDGRPRFRKALVMIARQNGKSLVAKILILYWLFIEHQRKVLATSTNRDYARVAWYETLDMIKECEWLAKRLNNRETKFATGSEVITTTDRCIYKFAASNRRAGRSLTLNRVLLDELREHQSFEAWDAVTPTQKTIRDAMLVALSNAGGTEAVVLNQFRDEALAGDNDRIGIFEWSAEPDLPADDVGGILASNPLVGYLVDLDELLVDARAAMAAGGEKLAGFYVEQLCRAVPVLDPAVNGWADCGTDEPTDLAEHRARTVLCYDVALDGSHATAVVGCLLEGTVHLEVVHAWAGYGCSRAVAVELPEIVERVRPALVGRFPNGPAATVGAELAARKGPRRGWPPRGVKLEEITNDVAGVCMSFSDLVQAGQVQHPNDPLMDAQVATAQRQRRGELWTFGRSASGGPIDAVYAAAGAAWLARKLPRPPAPLTIV